MKLELHREDDVLKTWLPLPGFENLGLDEQDEPEIEIIFSDTEEEDEPFPIQLTTLAFLVKHSEEILAAAYDYVFREREVLWDIFRSYEEDSEAGFRNLSHPSEVKQYVNLNCIYLYEAEHEEADEEMGYIGISGDCTWDEEHAMGIVLHRMQVVEFGSWDTAAYFCGEEEDDKENGVFSLASHFGLEDLQSRKKRLEASSLALSDMDVSAYVTLFDALVEQKRIYGYRATPVDLSDAEKAVFIQEVRFLNLSEIQEKEFLPLLGLAKKLVSIDLSKSDVSLLPDQIGQLSLLQYLILPFNSLEELPTSCTQLSQLEQLDLSNNQFEIFPAEIRFMHKLKSLDLSDNQITVIPDWIGELKQLEDVRITNNQVKELPESLSEITSLNSLELTENRFSLMEKQKIKQTFRDRSEVYVEI